MKLTFRLWMQMWVLGLVMIGLAGSPVWAQASEIITAGNAARLTEIDTLGYGYSTDVTWSPDGQTLAVGTTTGVLLYDSAALQGVTTPLKISAGLVNSAAFSPDGDTLAFATNNRIALWNRVSGQERVIGQAEVGDEFIGIAFSPDGSQLATGSAGDTVRLWDVATGEMLATFVGHEHSVTEVVFSPNGELIAASGGYDDGMTRSDGVVRVWHIATGELYRTFGAPTNHLNGVAFSPDGTILATGGQDNRVHLWDLASGEPLVALAGHSGDVVSVAFSADGTMLASSAGWEDGAVYVWNVASGGVVTVLEGCIRAAHTGEMGRVVFHPDGTMIASTCSSSGIMFWDVMSGDQHPVTQGYTSPIWSTVFSPDGAILAVGGGDGWTEPGVVRLWDVDTRTERAVLHGHTAWVRAVAFSPDGTLLASGGVEGTVYLWDIATEEPLLTLPRVNAGDSGYTTISDEDGDWVFHPDLSSAAVWSVAFSPDGATLAVGRGDAWVGPGSFQLYDVETGEILADVRPQAVPGTLDSVAVYDLVFSPDGSMLALVNGHREVQLWDTASLEVVATLSTETGWYANGVAFSPDGTLLAGAGGWTDCNGWEVSCSPDDTQGVIQLWDVETTEPVAVLRGDTWNANSTTFSPDGSLLVSGSDDGKLQLWDLTTEAVLFEVELPRGGVSSVAFSPDGRLFATGGWDGVVHLWGVTTTE